MRGGPRGSEGISLYGLYPGVKSGIRGHCFQWCWRIWFRSIMLCRVIDAFVDGLPMPELACERPEAAGTGRPGCGPRGLLKAVSVRLCSYDPFFAAS
jgi:hypothetical protein